MKTQIKILGAVYIGISASLGLFILVFLAFLLFGNKANKPPDALSVITPLLGLLIWFWLTGSGLWRLNPGTWLLALITAVVLMLVLHGLLVFADRGKFVKSAGQRFFHLGCMAIGLYTVVILLLPGGRAAFRK